MILTLSQPSFRRWLQATNQRAQGLHPLCTDHSLILRPSVALHPFLGCDDQSHITYEPTTPFPTRASPHLHRCGTAFILVCLGCGAMVYDAGCPLPHYNHATYRHASCTTQAHQAGQLGVTFSGAGFFLAYYMGIAQEFVRMGIIKDDTPVAGASAGALTAAIIKSKVPFHTIRESIHTMTNDVLQNGLMKRLGIALASNLEAYLPPDAHEHCSNGSVFLAITRALPYPKIKLYSKFDSRDDLKAALLASCHLPYLSNGDMTVPFRSKRCYDGGLLDLLPCPPGADYTITITAFPASEIHKLPGMTQAQHISCCCAALARRAGRAAMPMQASSHITPTVMILAARATSPFQAAHLTPAA